MITAFCFYVYLSMALVHNTFTLYTNYIIKILLKKHRYLFILNQIVMFQNSLPRKCFPSCSSFWLIDPWPGVGLLDTNRHLMEGLPSVATFFVKRLRLWKNVDIAFLAQYFWRIGHKWGKFMFNWTILLQKWWYRFLKLA